MELPRLVLVWRATERCDTACSFCAYDVRVARPRRELDAREALRFGTLAGAWAAARGRELLVSWLGGEPFLWPPLATVSEQLAGQGIRVGLTTNGRALADDGWRRFALATLAELTVSLDGPPSLHDRLRHRRGLGEAVLAALAALRSARVGTPLLRVNSVLMRDNLAGFAELCERVCAAGVDELTFNALGGNDRPEFFPAHRLRGEDVEAFAAALPGLRAAAAAHGLVVRGADSYLARLSAGARGVAVPVEDCSPARDFWFIEADGRLAPCSFTVGDYGIRSAELRGFEDLDRLAERFTRARAGRRAAACADCPSTQVHAKFGEAVR